MQFNGVNNKERQCSLGVSSISYMGMRQDPMCSLTEACALTFMDVLAFISVGFCVGARPQGSPPPPHFPPSFPLFTQCDRCLPSLLRGGSWLACQDLPAMGAVSIWELAANSGISWISPAPYLNFVMQLLKGKKKLPAVSY